MLVAGAALALGAALPWAHVSAPDGRSFTTSSVADGNHGLVMVGAGVVAIVVTLVVRASRTSALVTGIAGLAALGFGLDDFLRMQRVVEHAENVLPAPVNGSIGLGLLVTLLASIAVTSTSVWLLVLMTDLRPMLRARRHA
jgi:hypothetical protein